MRTWIPSLFILAPLVCCDSLCLIAKDKKSKSYDELPILEPKKKPGDDATQTLPLPKEPPAAVAADPRRLIFQTSPLSAKGLLTSQTRDALHALLRTNRTATIVKLRAFVAGSGDMRRVQDLAAEVFAEKHQPMPALSIVQAGALPVEGAQVVIESIAEDKRVANPNGLIFVSAQTGANVGAALDKVRVVLRQAGVEPVGVLRVTCFVGALGSAKDGPPAVFPEVSFNLVQMQREAVRPVAACDAIARLSAPESEPLRLVNGAALVSAPRVAFSGMQLGFGSQPGDIRMALDRLQKALASVHSDLQNTAILHAYVMSNSQAEKIRAAVPAWAATFVPMEGLPSLDAAFAMDVVALAKE